MDDVFGEVCVDVGGTSYCFANEEDAEEFVRCVANEKDAAYCAARYNCSYTKRTEIVEPPFDHYVDRPRGG